MVGLYTRTIFIFILTLFISCVSTPEETKVALAASKNVELSKLISNYSPIWNQKKLSAAYFLIGNMRGRSSYGGETVDNFDDFFKILDSLYKKKIYLKTLSPIVQSKWDSLEQMYGAPAVIKAEEYPDIDSIKSSYLIESIDLSFKVREEVPAANKLNFEQFCEYILPYRIGNEQLENWRGYFYNKYKVLRDSLKHDAFLLGTAIYKDIQKSHKSNRAISAYPFDIPASKMSLAHCGTCRNIAIYTLMALRANGVPSVIDFTPFWGNRNSGHEWVSILNGNKFVPLEEKGPYKISKIFRMTYGRQDVIGSGSEDLPAGMLDPLRKDVTDEYMKSYTIRVPIKKNVLKKKYALICTYSKNNWVAQDYGIVKDSTATFQRIGGDILYIAMFYDKGKLVPASEPFILEKNGFIKKISLNKSHFQTLRLNRKFPLFPTTVKLMKKMVGSRFQGANKPDFSDSVNLYLVKSIPEKIETARIDNHIPFRYIRYISNKLDGANLAEMSIYGIDQKKLTGSIFGFPQKSKDRPYSYYYSFDNAFDGDYDTFFETGVNSVGWVGFDFGKPTKISKIRYAPQSDTNFIIPGDSYELYYWDFDKWTLVDKKTGDGEYVEIENAPSGGLYLLRNRSRGSEERIFTYENNKQVWR